MPLEPPTFQEADRCDVCKCSFSTFRRRHHCRCCGRTLCNEHSANQMALPKFEIFTPVRVCANCFNESSRTPNAKITTDIASSAAEEVSRLAISSESNAILEATSKTQTDAPNVECKCGMPLCICRATSPPKEPMLSLPKTPSNVIKSPPLKPKRVDRDQKNKGSTSSYRNSSSIFSHNQSNNEAGGNPLANYEVNGEGAREAIKGGDTLAVKKLLDDGVDANYCDKQGMSLLHLAALFNRTEIAFMLMDYGANFICKNAQGETPIECAPATLQYKMKEKIEELNTR